MSGIARWPIALCLCLTLHAGVAAAAEPSSDVEDRPKIGLALSGGGARGAAHIGVLEVIEERRVPIDYIAGTSMGAIIGGLYASGMTVEELKSLIATVDWDDVLDDSIPREDRSFRRKRDDDYFLVKSRPGISGFKLRLPPGVLDAWKVDLMLKRYTLPVVTERNFQDLSIPFKAIAADLETGEVVVLDHGDLALAIRSSMSIPVAFAPREIDGKLLVDGGISNNLPVEIVREMGAGVVIAVDISSPLSEREKLDTVLGVTEQITSIMTRRSTDQQIGTLSTRDIFIQPDLGEITTASFNQAENAVPAGVVAANAVGGRLDDLSIPEREYAELQKRRVRDAAPPVIDEIRIVNDSRVSDKVIGSYLRVKTGEPLDVERLESDLRRIYGLELFELVYYDITEEEGKTVLTVTVRQRSWGPNYLQFGMAIFEDYEGPNFNFSAAYIKTAVNRLNGEWRTILQVGQEPALITEFYQPLDHGLRYFAHALALVGERTDRVFDADHNVVSEWGVFGYGGELALGRELGTWGQLRLGAIRAAGTYKVQIGDPGLPDMDFDTGETYAQFFVDELDNVAFPSRGGNFRTRLIAGRQALGSDSDYEQGVFEGSYPITLGRNTALLGPGYSGTRDSDAPIQSLFRLGGFTRISGYEHNELAGQHSALLYGVFYRRMTASKLLPVYAGLSLEYGNVFQEASEIKFSSGIPAGSLFA
jgi:NTE family protein